MIIGYHIVCLRYEESHRDALQTAVARKVRVHYNRSRSGRIALIIRPDGKPIFS